MLTKKAPIMIHDLDVFPYDEGYKPFNIQNLGWLGFGNRDELSMGSDSLILSSLLTSGTSTNCL